MTESAASQCAGETPEDELPDRDLPEPPPRPVRAVVSDWGGVLTNPILETVEAWLRLEKISRDSYLNIMRLWLSQPYTTERDENPVHLLERGECDDEEFERTLARHLVRVDGSPVPHEGLLSRMFAGLLLDDSMRDLLRALRELGIKTALLSNSWGRDSYPRQSLEELFDAVVISCEVGMRKPEERIFAYTARLLSLDPEECVFIDDVKANVVAAQAAGFLVVHHRAYQVTVQRLSQLIGIPLYRRRDRGQAAGQPGSDSPG
ncbi:MAG: HAD family hydrolase [Streptosporangiaceae bacterium]